MSFHDWSNQLFRFLLKMALVPLVLLCVWELILGVLRQLSGRDLLIGLLLLVLASPFAYWILQARRGPRPHHEVKRGAERTPVLPHNEEHE